MRTKSPWAKSTLPSMRTKTPLRLSSSRTVNPPSAGEKAACSGDKKGSLDKARRSLSRPIICVPVCSAISAPSVPSGRITMRRPASSPRVVSAGEAGSVACSGGAPWSRAGASAAYALAGSWAIAPPQAPQNLKLLGTSVPQWAQLIICGTSGCASGSLATGLASAEPQPRQNLYSSSFSRPHLLQLITATLVGNRNEDLSPSDPLHARLSFEDTFFLNK